MLPSFTLPGMCQAIVDFQIHELILVPPILIRLVRDPIVSKYDLRCVQRWSSGSAPISPGIIKELQQKFPWTGFRQGYGATESTACIVSCSPVNKPGLGNACYSERCLKHMWKATKNCRRPASDFAFKHSPLSRDMADETRRAVIRQVIMTTNMLRQEDSWWRTRKGRSSISTQARSLV
jgi:acyl-CoA synthetase (AMP-forming)/AMP-acid ligase II